MKRIIATCDPHNARHHYHGEKVVEYDGATPVRWVIGKYDTLKEAKEALWRFALEDCDRNSANLSHEFDENIEADIKYFVEEEGDDEKETREWYASWYKGEGIYDNESREAIMLKGEESYSIDSMTYSIE